MKYIQLKTNDSTLIIYINREEKLNALNSIIIKELDNVLSLHQNDSTVKSIIITGSGEKAFVAGADITEMEKFSSSEAAEYSNNGINLL